NIPITSYRTWFCCDLACGSDASARRPGRLLRTVHAIAARRLRRPNHRGGRQSGLVSRPRRKSPISCPVQVRRRAPMKPSIFQETAAAVAKRFGVSVKALRIYEELGLLTPARTISGWRIYRQMELERLSAILALKQLGMTLKRIGELIGGSGDLSAALALQEAALVEAKAETEQALALVRAARAKLA